MAKKSNNNKKSSSRSAVKRAASYQQNKAKKEKTGFVAYFKGVRQELKKVVWPTRNELVSDTVVVFAVCVFFAVAFWLLDTGFLALLKQILGISLS